ncbi:MAG: hypothetical protein RSD14_02595 [Clostridia bacterium]
MNILGNCPVYIFYDGTNKVRLLNRNIWLSAKDETIENLCEVFGKENVKLK